MEAGVEVVAEVAAADVTVEEAAGVDPSVVVVDLVAVVEEEEVGEDPLRVEEAPEVEVGVDNRYQRRYQILHCASIACIQ